MKRKKDPSVDYVLLDKIKAEYEERFPESKEIRVLPCGTNDIIVEVVREKGADKYMVYGFSAYKNIKKEIRRI